MGFMGAVTMLVQVSALRQEVWGVRTANTELSTSMSGWPLRGLMAIRVGATSAGGNWKLAGMVLAMLQPVPSGPVSTDRVMFSLATAWQAMISPWSSDSTRKEALTVCPGWM